MVFAQTLLLKANNFVFRLRQKRLGLGSQLPRSRPSLQPVARSNERTLLPFEFWLLRSALCGLRQPSFVVGAIRYFHGSDCATKFTRKQRLRKHCVRTNRCFLFVGHLVHAPDHDDGRNIHLTTKHQRYILPAAPIGKLKIDD